MSAERKIPEHLTKDVISRSQAGWSQRRIAQWLQTDHALDVSRTAVTGCLTRAGLPEPEVLTDARRELLEEVPQNLAVLRETATEADTLMKEIRAGTVKHEDATKLMKLLFFRERVASSRLRNAGLRPPREAKDNDLDARWGTRRVEPAPTRPSAPPLRQPPLPRPAPAKSTPPKPSAPDIARNAKCPCGSGQKYKKCHGDPTRKPAPVAGTLGGTVEQPSGARP